MRRVLGSAVLLPLSLLCGHAAASESDPWFGTDKALHFGVSVALTAGGYAASSPWCRSHSGRAATGAGFSLTIGAGKELWDLAGHGDPSFRDFFWDVIGTAVGVALSLGVDAELGVKHDRAAAFANAQDLGTAPGPVFHF